MASQDDLGNRGEAIFVMRITDFCGRDRPFFRPRFLGEKAESLDYLVDLLGLRERTAYFFVQVKTPRQGYTKRRTPPRLKVEVAARDVRRLALFPAPTYVVGIDEPQEVGYILAVLSGMRKTISSLPTSFPLNCDNLRRLWREVKKFWDERDTSRRNSVFAEGD